MPKHKKKHEKEEKLIALEARFKSEKKDKAPKVKKSGKTLQNELEKLQIELVKLQHWVQKEKQRVVVVFEGRDAAGKGGMIRRISERLNPRICKVAALGTPTEKEKTQWYFQRYVAHLPAGGEIVLFDRSWYNRAGVERVMGFCTEAEYQEFLRSCPLFENMLVRSGIILIKYWFSVSDKVQEERFRERINNPLKRWKFSPMDLKSREKWAEYSKAKDEMFHYTDTRIAPWYVVHADSKKRSKLNCIAHLLTKILYKYKSEAKIVLPKLKRNDNYVRPPMFEQTFVPEIY
jgi:polyphosphate kinase 2